MLMVLAVRENGDKWRYLPTVTQYFKNDNNPMLVQASFVSVEFKILILIWNVISV